VDAPDQRHRFLLHIAHRVDGMMFLTEPPNAVLALDARTGRTLVALPAGLFRRTCGSAAGG
jgi:hypothetical protein